MRVIEKLCEVDFLIAGFVYVYTVLVGGQSLDLLFVEASNTRFSQSTLKNDRRHIRIRFLPRSRIKSNFDLQSSTPSFHVQLWNNDCSLESGAVDALGIIIIFFLFRFRRAHKFHSHFNCPPTTLLYKLTPNLHTITIALPFSTAQVI